MSATGIVFNIQRYSLHDGPGIRTAVFLKGCPLRCRWCCNPESQRPQPEISYIRSKCLGRAACGFCQRECSFGAISFDVSGFASVDRKKCRDCLLCAAFCPSKAICAEGREVFADEVLDDVEKDAVFYKDDGGLTVSGGEPLAQGVFLIELLSKARKRKIRTAIETCGFGDYSVLQAAAADLDMIFYDIKSLDSQKHREWTGRGNESILKNFKRLCADFPALPKVARTPVIPGFNDSEEALSEIREYVKGLSGVTFEALPYHRFGIGKYAALGRKYFAE